MLSKKITSWVLVKNEEANIGKCLNCLRELDLPCTVLDSGSSDNTKQISSRFTNVAVRDYEYTTHADAYAWITKELTAPDEWAIILDADMEIRPDLWTELTAQMYKNSYDVMRCPVAMFSGGHQLRFGSLCPPKPVAFRGGKNYFVACGHGEQLVSGAATFTSTCKLIHDDRKGYSDFLLSQVRYADSLSKRSNSNALSWRDRFRLCSPLLAIIVPLYSLLPRGGILDGKAGVLYAIDRAIAELIQYRQSLARDICAKQENDNLMNR